MHSDETSARQASELWSMLDLKPGCRVLDAPCGAGRLSRPLALLGAQVVGVDQSELLLKEAERRRSGLSSDALRYRQHDLRQPLEETGFDVACNIFTSFGYGTEDEDVEIFRNLGAAVRPGGRVVVETNHRDLVCTVMARGGNSATRLADGTIFLDEPVFDSLAGIVTLNWYWWGPNGAGQKRIQWRCYTATEMISLLERAGLRLQGAFKGLSKTPFKSEGPDAGGRLTLVAVP